MLIRREQAGDVAAIRVVHEAAFGRAAEATLVDRLRQDGDLLAPLSLVAVQAGEIVGHVVCSRATMAGRPSAGLGPLGVLPARQGRGVGSALVHAVLAAADALGEPGVVLLGSPRYYGRFGFVLAGTLGVTPPVPAWTPHFQIRTLAAWTPDLAGAFRYAPGFDDV
jgi:putative acetyltransferase